MGSVNMGRPVSQHRGGAAAAAAAVDVLTVATAVVGLPPTDDGAVDGSDAGGAAVVVPPTVDRGWWVGGGGGGGEELWPAAVEDGGCGETDVCRRAAVSDSCKGGGLEDDDEDVCGGCGNRDCGGGAKDAVWKRKIYNKYIIIFKRIYPNCNQLSWRILFIFSKFRFDIYICMSIGPANGSV